MAAYKIGINGFGRQGRLVLRAALEKGAEVMAINEPNIPIEEMANRFKYDTICGRFKGPVEVDSARLIVNGKPIDVFRENEPRDIPWSSVGVDYVVETTSIFSRREKASAHIHGGAKKVFISTLSPRPPFVKLFIVDLKFLDGC